MLKLLSILLITEVLFNPISDGADYVELYNNTDDTIALSDYYLAKMTDGIVSKLYPMGLDHKVAPHDYVVLTTDAADILSTFCVRYPSKLVEMKSMPSYPNAAGSVVLVDKDTLVVDRFDYSESMHSRLIRNAEGVSLERRSLTAATDDRSNWYSAASTTSCDGRPGRGTPTSANSQSKEFLFEEDDFVVEPSIFSPDGDGYNDLMDVSYQMLEDGLSADVAIYDSQGRKVRQLLRGGLLGYQGVLTWDGLDDNGRICHRGIYTIVIVAINLSGVKQISKKAVTLVVK